MRGQRNGRAAVVGLVILGGIALACDQPVSGNRPTLQTNLEAAAPPVVLPAAAPIDLVASAVSPSQIDLSWTDGVTNEDGSEPHMVVGPRDGGGNGVGEDDLDLFRGRKGDPQPAPRFRIERCAGVDCDGFVEVATVGANVVSYQNAGLSASTSYTYRLRAYGATGLSAFSNAATATTLDRPPPPPASEGTLATDLFNRADETPLRGGWASGPGGFTDLRLVSNGVRGVTVSGDGIALYNPVGWPNDHWSEARISGLGFDGGGVAVRVSAHAQTAYVFYVGSSGTWYSIGKFVNGAYSWITNGSAAVAVGDVLRLEVQGTTLRAFHNGAEVTSVVDASIPSGGAGIFIHGDDPGVTQDYWAGGAHTACPPTSDPRIAFASTRTASSNDIYVMDADGCSTKQLTSGAEASQPAWSPDGRLIVFKRSNGWVEGIYVMNADGSAQTRLTGPYPGIDGRPSWSPDGRQIAFVSHQRDAYDRDIYVMNADGTSPTRLTTDPGDDSGPRWSPDGRHIAFFSTRNGNQDIYVMNADGSGVTRLTNHPGADFTPDWSPDGQSIAFGSQRDGNLEVYVMNADGSTQINVTNHPAEDVDPTWSPDGTRLAFRSRRDGDVEIYMMGRDGTGLKRLTNTVGFDGDPRWSRVSHSQP